MADGWGLVMPFVVCQSQGGPYEDESFCAGYGLGQLDTALLGLRALDPATARWSGPVRSASLAQVDLIAMRHSMAMTIVSDDGEWATVDLAPEG